MTTPFSMFDPLLSPNVLKLKPSKEFSTADWISITHVNAAGSKFKVRLLPCNDLDLEHVLRTISEFFSAVYGDRFGVAQFISPNLAVTLFVQLLDGPVRDNFQSVANGRNLGHNFEAFKHLIHDFV